MISAAIPGAVTYTLLWFVPPGIDDVEHSDVVKFFYYLFFYFAFQTVLTVGIPHPTHSVLSINQDTSL